MSVQRTLDILDPKRIAAAGAAIQRDYERIVTKVIWRMMIDIAERTPVRTGKLRSSWRVNKAGNDGYEGSEIGPESTREANAAAALEIAKKHIKGFKYEISDGVIYIYNNVKYAKYIEYGTSKIAPSQMMTATLQDFNVYLNEARKESLYFDR